MCGEDDSVGCLSVCLSASLFVYLLHLSVCLCWLGWCGESRGFGEKVGGLVGLSGRKSCQFFSFPPPYTSLSKVDLYNF